jgi:hypothetical protein
MRSAEPKGDRAAIKRKIVEIAYRKGSDYVAQLPGGLEAQGRAEVGARARDAV